MAFLKSGHNILSIQESSPTPEGWYPPSDWNWDTVKEQVQEGDDAFVALYMAFPDVDNYIAFKCTFTGTATVDWGDGSASSSVTSNVQKETLLDYDNIPGGIIPSLGCKLAIIHFQATGAANDFNFVVWHSFYTTNMVTYGGRNWLAIKAYATGSRINYFRWTLLKCVIVETNKPLLAMQPPPYSLKKIEWQGIETPTTPNNWAASGFRYSEDLSAFYYSNYNINDLPWDKSAAITYCLQGVEVVLGNTTFEQSIPNVTSLLSVWQNHGGFKRVILTDTNNVTDIRNTIYQSDVEYFSMDDASNVTLTTNFVRISGAAYNITKELILSGLTVGINISYGKMDTDALDNFFTALGTANGAQTITVTGNPGAATCDTSIATNKGWTVTT
jgi:hypothetical protein